MPFTNGGSHCQCALPGMESIFSRDKACGLCTSEGHTGLGEIGIAHSGQSKQIDELHTKDFDLVVTVCDSAAEECPIWPGKAGRRVHHSFVDPAKAEGTDEEQMAVFREVRSQMLEVIPKLLGENTQ